MKNLVVLGTVHQYQMGGNDLALELEKRLDYLRSKSRAQIVMEEWAEKHGESGAAKYAAKSGLHWANVGTTDEAQFPTYRGPINYPGHYGTLPYDEDAPGMDEYGPFTIQEARENQITKNIQTEMQSHESGLVIVGCAHLHSLFGKLLALGLNVTGYSWL